MRETRPVFIINKYRSIFRAAIIIEAVSFIVSLTDGIIAGNVLGAEALAAIGLLAPFVSISTFFSSIINTGTVLNFSYEVGKFNKRRANEIFSQGVITALLMGAIYALALLLLGFVIISWLSPSKEIMEYLSDYYYIISLFIFLQPVSFLLDNILVSDGGETLSVAANIMLIVSNVVCSVLFVQFWDIRGIAIASVLSKLMFILVICSHFFSRENTLKILFHWNVADLFRIIRSGIVKASTYAFEAILTFCINLFAIINFSEDTLIILVVVERFLGLLTLFIGLSMSCQPIVGTLRGENNTKAQQYLMQTVLKDMILVSGILSLLTFFGAPILAISFGITEGELYYHSILAIRIVSSTLILQGVLVLFFIYYVTIDKQALAFLLCFIKNLFSPLVLAVVLATLLQSQIGIWIGLAIAPMLALSISVTAILLRYGRKPFPFLIPENQDQKIYIYDFTVEPEYAVKMSETAGMILKQFSFPDAKCTIAGLITEELLMMIREKNESSKKPICAEWTFITNPDGITLITRDSGVFFDITDGESRIDSFRQYIISNLMANQQEKLYMVTTGYNRSEFFFAR